MTGFNRGKDEPMRSLGLHPEPSSQQALRVPSSPFPDSSAWHGPEPKQEQHLQAGGSPASSHVTEWHLYAVLGLLCTAVGLSTDVCSLRLLSGVPLLISFQNDSSACSVAERVRLFPSAGTWPGQAAKVHVHYTGIGACDPSRTNPSHLFKVGTWSLVRNFPSFCGSNVKGHVGQEAIPSMWRKLRLKESQSKEKQNQECTTFQNTGLTTTWSQFTRRPLQFHAIDTGPR